MERLIDKKSSKRSRKKLLKVADKNTNEIVTRKNKREMEKQKSYL